jgi:ABC-type transporter Mla maintaining outer membrane lipid asymmetry ATPase subunit MlaF
MPSVDVVISLRDVRKDYRGLRPLRLQSLEVRQGESVALVGLDSTAAEVFVNLVIGATLPDSGEVLSFGTPTSAITDADEWLAGMHRFAILSERVVLLESFTVEQNLALPFSLDIDRISDEVSSQVRELADEVGLASHVLAEAVGTLNAGALHRTRLAKALALGPRVLLAEHPNAVLPAEELPRFATELAAIAARRQLAMVVITADATFARAVAGRAFRVHPATGQLTTVGGWKDWLTRR